jgi:hypothetical protein
LIVRISLDETRLAMVRENEEPEDAIKLEVLHFNDVSELQRES